MYEVISRLVKVKGRVFSFRFWVRCFKGLFGFMNISK